MSNVLYISEDRVKELLTWEETVDCVELALKSITLGQAVQNERTITNITSTDNVLYTMPGYLNHSDYKSLACKMVTCFPSNSEQNMPSVLAHIMLFNEKSGELQAVIAGTEITAWRTAAASVIATKHLHFKNLPISGGTLAVIGSGVQARAHVQAFQHFFKFSNVNIWNRNFKNVQKLIEKLECEEEIHGIAAFENIEDCVRDADVIVTTTNSKSPLLKYIWLKPNVHINAVGAGKDVLELDAETYKHSQVFVDHMSGVSHELLNLVGMGVKFSGEIGQIITKAIPLPNTNQSTIFQSLGMAVEDCAMAKMISNKHNFHKKAQRI